jgi:gluconate 2-dehydrogenase
VHGATLGILGMGRIGQAIARRGALGFGMKVLYHNRSRLDGRSSSSSARAGSTRPRCCARPTTWCWWCPTARRRTTMRSAAADLALMKPTATLTNIARGGVVDDAALAQALRERRIAAAGLDVFEGEPAVHPDLLPCPTWC